MTNHHQPWYRLCITDPFSMSNKINYLGYLSVEIWLKRITHYVFSWIFNTSFITKKWSSSSLLEYHSASLAYLLSVIPLYIGMRPLWQLWATRKMVRALTDRLNPERHVSVQLLWQNMSSLSHQNCHRGTTGHSKEAECSVTPMATWSVLWSH